MNIGKRQSIVLATAVAPVASKQSSAADTATRPSTILANASVISDSGEAIPFEVVKIYDGFFQNNLKNAKQSGIFSKKLSEQSLSRSTDSESDVFNDHEDENSDVISDLIGHYGLYQFMWTVLLCLFQVPTTFHIFCTVFQAAHRDYWCRRPGHLQAIPVDIWKNFTQPAGEKCHTYGNINFSELNTTNFHDYFSRFNYSTSSLQSCSSFEFDNSMIGHTIISEWSIICGKEHMVSIVEMCFLAGAALGAVSSGWISDQFGRRHTLMYFAVAQTSIGTALAFCESLPLFMALRFFIGFCSMAVTVVSFVLVIELVSGKYRTIIGIVNIIPVAISYILSAGIHYVAVDWRPMQLYITSPGYVLVFVWYFLPESPRWLLAKGRTDELAVIIRKAAHMNRRSLPSNFEKTLAPPEETTDKRMVSVMDLFQPAFRRTTLLMTVIWFSIILIYFGITLHMSNLGGNIYVNTVIAGSVETIAITLSILVVLKLGLRVNLVIYLLVAGTACLLTNFASEGNLWFILSLAMIVKCTIGAANAIIPIFTAMQYPVSKRNLGVGIGNFSAGLALICVPYLWLLEHIEVHLPMTIMGCFGVVGAIALLLLHDKLSKKSTNVVNTEDVIKDFGRGKLQQQQENGLSNLGFTQNESVQL